MTSVIGREIKLLYEKDGFVSPTTVLDAGRAKNHPLHPFFTWDNSVAAEEYRLQQARNMILATKFVVFLKEDNKKVAKIIRKVHHVRQFLQPEVGAGVYLLRQDVLDDRDYRSDFIDRKKKELRSWCASIVDVKELASLRDLIQRNLNSD